MAKNYKYLICKALVNSGKVSTLELMRRNEELLEVPGYFVSNILNEMFEKNIIERAEEENKFIYFSTTKTEEWLEAEEKRISIAKEKAIARANQKKAQQQSTQSGCYIATCVYGSYDCPEVWTLRRYRDNTLASTWYGRWFIKTYYAISPTVVKWFGCNEWFKKTWQIRLDRIVTSLQAKGVESTPYQDRTRNS